MIQIAPALTGSQPGFILPNHLFGWFGWAVMAFLLGWGIYHWRHENVDSLRKRWWLTAALFISAVLFTRLVGVLLPGQMQPMPGVPMDVSSPSLLFFAALPWVLAGCLLGAVPAAAVGLVSGFILGIYETHSPFTPLEIGLIALVYGAAVRQNYRTWFYRFLRHPLAAAVVVIPVLISIQIVGTLFSTNDTLAVRLDYAFTQVWLIAAARAGELLIAGAAAEILFLLRRDLWGTRHPPVPSPSESSIQARFFFGTVPLVTLLVLTLVVGDWLVAGSAARRMIEERLTSTAQVAGESLPYFLETGQNLILSHATPDLLAATPEERVDMMMKRLRAVPYFRQLSLFGAAGEPMGGFPEQDFSLLDPTQEEMMGIQLALKGVTTQVYVVPPMMGEKSAQVSFLAAIRDTDGQVKGVLLGRTDMSTNPFTQPAIKALAGMSELGGQGMILSENGTVLYHPVTTEVMKPYLGFRPQIPSFFDETSPSNTRQFVYYQPVNGRPWAIVLAVPAKLAQQIALDIAIPLLIMLAVFSVLAFLFLRYSLQQVTASLQALALESSYIAMGQLDRPMHLKGVDEIGQLSMAFEQMRISLKARLEELNSLLKVSQGVSANLDISESVQPILEAALTRDACAARLVLIRDVTLDTNDRGTIAFGTGPASALYTAFDQQLFDLTAQQEMISLSNVARTRRLQFSPGSKHPGSLLAMAVRHKNRYYGVLWVAYDRPRTFSQEEIRFLRTLSGEAALAATSARLYATAEVGRQRLEAVLASTPEPVLVIDEQARLLLLNMAAVQVPGLVKSSIEGSPIEEVLGQPELVQLLTISMTERILSREICLPNGKVYYASVSSVLAEGRSVGRVCILRDITHFKELEQLKSDFVATVSHDLRSPLTLMRGYATMLQKVGDLNEQQKGYVRKIVMGVENMNRLVSNLLDLGRIEAGIGLQIDKVSVIEVTEEVLNSLQLQAVQKNIRLVQESENGGDALVIDADRALVQQALHNLVENAIKYTPVGGQVKVRIEGRPNSVQVEVHDTGIGIAPLDQPHLFEKFYRSGRREAYQQRGTGLGLAIVKSIVERHGGRIWVDSQLGKGSIFTFEVPCEQPQKTDGEN
ncbi:MAG: GAF domain-containing protein [Chloroflexi bacterium]|nr:GAF domain-containing protein [Chloroflexota bacterium]